MPVSAMAAAQPVTAPASPSRDGTDGSRTITSPAADVHSSGKSDGTPYEPGRAASRSATVAAISAGETRRTVAR